MAVIYHGFRWDPTAAACEAARAMATLSGEALSQVGRERLATAGAWPDRLAAFGLGDPSYAEGYLDPEVVVPGLIWLLTQIPALEPLGDEAMTLARCHRQGGSPVAPLAAAGDLFMPLAEMVTRVCGQAWPAAAMPWGEGGHWVEAGELLVRLRATDDPAALAMTHVATPGSWLATTIVW
jgi:hypothetical protein